MNTIAPTKEYSDFLVQRLSEILPEFFRLHSKLIEIADPISHKICCSLQQMAIKLGYENYHLLFYFLSGLAALKFISLPSCPNPNDKIEISVLVYSS